MITADGTNPSTRDDRTARRREAALVLLLRLRDLGQALDAPRRWRAGSQNQAVFEEVRELWDKVGQLPRFNETRLTQPTRAQPLPAPRSFIAVHRWSIAICLAIVAISMGLLSLHMGADNDPVVQTQSSEWRSFTLPDGSNAQLAPMTRLALHFDDDSRSARLNNGAAYFEVVADHTRPFVVDTDLGAAQAVGTAFGVERHGDKMVVTVDKGTVAIAEANASMPRRALRPTMTLTPGDQVTVTRNGAVRRSGVDVELALAWRDHLLTFDNDVTVAEAAQKFNSLNELKIEIIGNEIATSRVGGTYSVDDPASYAGVVATVLNATVERVGDDVLRIAPRPAGANRSQPTTTTETAHP